MPSYMISEPHPTVAANTYTHSGRGGAGNMFRAPATTAPSGVATPAVSKSTTKRYYSGRGGAGNAHAAQDRPVLSFEDEYVSAAAREKHASGHVGRGGAGNVFSTSSAASDSSSRRDSSSTNGSTRSGFWGRLSSSH